MVYWVLIIVNFRVLLQEKQRISWEYELNIIINFLGLRAFKDYSEYFSSVTKVFSEIL